MKNNTYFIEESDQSSFISMLNLFQMQRQQLSKDKVTSQPSFINFTAIGPNQNSIGGISGWKSFDYSYIESIWVDPSFQRNGLGSDLIKRFIDKSDFLGCSIVITSSTNKSESFVFWKKNGFVEFAELETDLVVVKYFKKSTQSPK